MGIVVQGAIHSVAVKPTPFGESFRNGFLKQKVARFRPHVQMRVSGCLNAANRSLAGRL